MKIAWVPFKTWDAWTLEERGQFSQYCEANGLALALDMQSSDPDADQKDLEEYREDMNLGGRRIKTR